MDQAELIIFLILSNLIIAIFIAGIFIFIHHYTKRKQLHEEEKTEIERRHRVDLLNNQVQIQQQTMQFIGREIHDSISQKLTLASIYSQKLEFENQLPSLTENLSKISGIINDSLDELRDLSRALADNSLEHSSLKDLLHAECKRINDSGVCRVVLSSRGNGAMSVTVKRFLLRVFQEFIQNSLKHSGCSQIQVSLNQTEAGLSLQATDNGKGFDREKISSNGIGLANMKRRVQMIGGEFSLKSGPGEGTVLTLFVPKENLEKI